MYSLTVPRRVVITGAFSFTGAAVARELARRGFEIHTLTNRRAPSPTTITSSPLRFDHDHLVRAFTGADVFVNTYWVRFARDGQTFETAVDASRTLFDAARAAGVRRIVHVSVSNASTTSPLGYYRGKALVEDAVRAAGVSHAIVRPTLIVGPGDVLTSNIAWFLRRFPLFLVPDEGRYRVQPVTIEDAARIVSDAVEVTTDCELDAAGPEVFTFRNFVETIAVACGGTRRLVGAPRWLALAALWPIGICVRDVVLTLDEIRGLEQDLLVSHAPALGTRSVRQWLLEHGSDIGRAYTNDVHRHFGAGRIEPIGGAELGPGAMGRP
jgi:NADH dehydrogenase